MSVIVYRDGVMAADTRAWAGSHSPIGEKMKIRRLADGCLVGVTTSKPGQGEALMDWFAAGCDQDARPDFAQELNFTMLAVRPDGQAMLFNDDYYPSGPLVAPYFAIGSGSDFAHGALACGASAIQAVQIAIELDTVSGKQVSALSHTNQAVAAPAREQKPAEAPSAPSPAPAQDHQDAA